MKNDGGPAFPNKERKVIQSHDGLEVSVLVPGEKGMSLRDWFAGQALTGILASESADWQSPDDTNVRRAFTIADAMLAEREKGNDSSS